MKLFSSILAALGIKVAEMGSQACLTFFWDEEETPKSLVK